MMFITMSRV